MKTFWESNEALGDKIEDQGLLIRHSADFFLRKYIHQLGNPAARSVLWKW
jgi:hypothetical protein